MSLRVTCVDFQSLYSLFFPASDRNSSKSTQGKEDYLAHVSEVPILWLAGLKGLSTPGGRMSGMAEFSFRGSQEAETERG